MPYNFDPVGDNIDNFVSNEEKTISSINGTAVNYFFLDAAPFYADSVVVVDKATGNALDPKTDFTFGHEYVYGSAQIGKSIWGSVVLTDPNRSGTYSISYRTVGGEFVNDANLLLVDGLGILSDLQNIKWEEVANIPSEFPPTPHNHPASGLDGLSEVLGKLTEISNLLESSTTQIQFADVVDLDINFVNPLIANLSSIASKIEAIAVGNSHYYKEYSTIGAYKEIATPVLGNWNPTDVRIDIDVDGTFLLMVSEYLIPTWTSSEGKLQYRWTLNGQPLQVSYSRTAIVAAKAGQYLRLEVRTTVANADKIVYSDSFQSSSITALRVANFGG